MLCWKLSQESYRQGELGLGDSLLQLSSEYQQPEAEALNQWPFFPRGAQCPVLMLMPRPTSCIFW